MKVKTNRAWQLETKTAGDCLTISEKHDDSEGEKPYIVIPAESVDGIIDQLLKLKNNQKHIRKYLVTVEIVEGGTSAANAIDKIQAGLESGGFIAIEDIRAERIER